VLEGLRARGLWQSWQSIPKAPRKIVATYGYTGERGDLLYQVVRYDPKEFKQRRPDGHGGWIWKKGPRQVLYRLSEVIEAPIVFVVEGERDVETLRDYGFVATINAGGADAPWLPQYTKTLSDKEVILIPDNDSPGKRRVLKIARALVGRVAKLIVLELKDAKDITAWFERGHSELELIAQVEGQAVNQ
jgi:5S rRNA maturation endonuclease (ribonuclease M5)